MPISRQRAGVYAATSKTRKATGFRGNLELAIAGSLEAQGCRFLYEPVRLSYSKPHVYILDYALLEQAIVLEAKGYFDSPDRTKMLLVKQQYPDLDIRFIFTNSNTRLSAKSKTTYGMWCKKHGFPYADKAVPPEWLAHRPNEKQKATFAFVLAAAARPARGTLNITTLNTLPLQPTQEELRRTLNG